MTKQVTVEYNCSVLDTESGVVLYPLTRKSYLVTTTIDAEGESVDRLTHLGGAFFRRELRTSRSLPGFEWVQTNHWAETVTLVD